MILGALAILVLPAAPASAHAELEQTAPVAGTVLDQLPGEVTLTFSEQVRMVADKIRVTGPDGNRADTGKPTVRDTELVIPLKSGGGKGTYLVSYRIISADSHPVSGGYSFSFGQPSAVPNANDPGSSVQTDTVVKDAMSAARFLGFAGLVLLIGPALVPGRAGCRPAIPGAWRWAAPDCSRSARSSSCTSRSHTPPERPSSTSPATPSAR
jgi:copper transport protein